MRTTTRRAYRSVPAVEGGTPRPLSFAPPAPARTPKRAKQRTPAVLQTGPLWPLSLEMSRAGCGIGVLLAQHMGGKVSVVTVDVDGVLVMLATLDRMKDATRWCVLRHVRIMWSLGQLLQAMEAGRCVGWVPGKITEHQGARTFQPVAVPFPFQLLTDSDHGAYFVPEWDPELGDALDDIEDGQLF